MESESTCPVCKGSKFTQEINLMKARTTRTPCVHCGGKGYIKAQQTDGIRCGRRLGETWFWQHLKDAHIIATLEIRVCPVTINGIPQSKINNSALSLKKGARVPRLFIEIVRMNTAEGFQRRGLMEQLVLNACGDPKIEWAESSLDDSSPEGIALLKKCGFVEEGNKLVREMYAQPA
jgi:DnaJ-class molecular chaperone